MEKVLSDKKKINIATPVVWASSGMINHFVGNMSKLIDILNSTAQKCRENFEVEKAIIDVHSVQNSDLLNYFEYVEVNCFTTPEKERHQKGMAHWWFTSVKRAFDFSAEVGDVLYCPFDVCWDDTIENTVVNPFRLCGMIKYLVQGDNELLVIGNYTSTNKNKELIEKEVRHILRDRYPNLDKEVKRVRSEYWGINRKLFENFENAHFEDNHFPIVTDPTLFLILYCLTNQKKIIPYDLGSYKVTGEWSNEKMISQIERASKLIDDFEKLYNNK